MIPACFRFSRNIGTKQCILHEYDVNGDVMMGAQVVIVRLKCSGEWRVPDHTREWTTWLDACNSFLKKATTTVQQ